MYHSHLLRIRSVFTDHSLFGFGDAVGVLTNKLLAGALRNVDGVICVSNTGYVSSSDRGTLLKGRRENTVLRAQLDPNLVYVIPNALIADQFKPSPVVNNPEHSKSLPSYPRSPTRGSVRKAKR
jgi:phosphatidylinositol glycan class A protein